MNATRYCVLALLIVLLFVLQSAFAFFFATMPDRIELHAAHYDLPPEEGLSTSDLRLLSDRTVSYEKNTRSSISSFAVTVTATNENYTTFEELTLIRGVFFGKVATQIGLNNIVISDTLAFNLFRTLNAQGLTLTLDGHVYSVCGVYHRNAMFETFSGDGSEVVYIPSNSGFDRTIGSDAAIQRIMVLPTEKKNTFEDDELYAFLERSVPNARNYLVKDYLYASQIVGQGKQMGLLFCAFLVLLLVGEVILRSVVHMVNEQNGALKKISLKCLLRQNAKRYILVGVSILFFALLSSIFYHFFTFDLYVPNKIISSESLFDFQYYRYLITYAIQEQNVYFAAKKPGYARVYELELFGNALLTFFSSAFALKLYTSIRSAARKNYSKKYGE